MIRFGPAGHVGVIMSLLRPFLVGDAHVFVDRFDANVVAELCDRYGVSRTNAVPTHVSTMLDAGGGRLPASLTYLLLGGTSVPVPFMEQLDVLGIRAVRTWGMSEQPVTTAGLPDEPLTIRGHSDGRPVRGNVVRTVDDRGQELPPGDPGELVTMGPQMFLGYLDPRLDADAFTDDGFYRTGDIGVIDAAGYVTIVDRKKDIVVRGGENISLREVEELLLRHPVMREAAVVVFPDARLGERVGVFVRLDNDATLTLDDIQPHFTALGVARQKTPEQIVIVDDFPRTAAGKVGKAALRKEMEARCASK
jgi:non-ribosomal peptide synthetase component E (peptide arylation enzyme)